MQKLLTSKLTTIRNYLTLPLSPDDNNSVSCSLCKEILFQPVICSNKCQQAFCRKCAMIWKQEHKSCPNLCSEDFSFTAVSPPQMEFTCPYSELCGISTHQDMVKHLNQCPFLPQEYKRLAKLREMNLCLEGHRLILWIDTASSYKTQCGICQTSSHSRYYCSTCNQGYCIRCRPVICSKDQPPIANTYLRFSLFFEIREIICDLCGLKPQFGPYSIRRDKECNINICDYCFNFLPQKIEHMPPYSSYSECLNHHSLSLLPKTIKNKCGYCYNIRPCQKYCSKCKQHYCLTCKKIEIIEEKCQHGHTFTMQNIETNKTIKPICNHCNRAISSSKNYFFDKICNLMVCKHCFKVAKFKEHNRLHIRGVQECQNPKHTMCLDKGNRRVIEECIQCERLTEAKYVCVECSSITQRIKLTCFKCLKPKQLEKCFLGHQLSVFSKDISRVCNLCEQCSLVTRHCLQCAYSICNLCYEKPKEK